MVGGTYRPLSDSDIERIHATALDVLADIGIGEPIPEVLDHTLPRGAELGDDGRLRFPRSMIEDLIASAATSYICHAPDPALDHEVSGQRVYFCTSGEAVRVFEFESQTYRPSTLVDLYDAARLADRMQNIHNYGQPFIATELSEDVYAHDINVAYVALAGTRKPFAIGSATAAHVDALVDMFDAYLGRPGAFLERPFCLVGGCPIVSPLRFGKENAEVLVRVAQLGMTADIAVAPQAGATAPGALAGALVQCFAETLACLAVVNCVRPGAPINFGMWPFVSDLRTGAFTGGSGEEALLMAATAQLANHYGLITSVATGMTDAKTVDAQAGYEKGITTAAAALAGGNLISVYPGILGSLMGQSFEGMVIDNDMLGNVARLVRGIEVTAETLSFDTIRDTVAGIGHYLGHPQTIELMRTEYEYPAIADRQSPGAWEAEGRVDIYTRAHERVREILAEHYPTYIDAAADERIRAAFPIRIDPADMRPGNTRW
jgi:trimethylamine--corrinoid protein Co-methyltransferase